MTDSPLIESLLAAVAARPDDLPLRLHLAELLLAAGRQGEAIGQLATALQGDPDSPPARALMARAVGQPPAGPTPPVPTPAVPTTPVPPADVPPPPVPTLPGPTPPVPTPPVPTRAGDAAGGREFDWGALEREFEGVVAPRFSDESGSPGAGAVNDYPEPVTGDGDGIVDVETPTVKLADVGGMEAVKKRLDLAFLGPLRNPELRAMYGKSLRGGLLLYGPPGCGKTFLARAVAGELGAKFVSLSIVDVLSMWIGNSERNLHEIFSSARRNGPCVLFLDEVDALGHKRSQIHSSAMRTLGNQLLAELDGMEGNNDGVFVLAATNAPWDVDSALRRPGRLDRMLLVLPPDEAARAAIIRYHLRGRPIAGINLNRIAARTDGFSGADLAHVAETAAEHALADSISTGVVRMIEQRDLDQALSEVRPSTGPWFATAKNVAQFSNDGGDYDELAGYLKRRKLI